MVESLDTTARVELTPTRDFSSVQLFAIHPFVQLNKETLVWIHNSLLPNTNACAHIFDGTELE